MYEMVAKFYEGQSVFVTGGTGFLGKVLIEKLLYSCPGIEKVYILIREKDTDDPQQRVQKMLQLPLFSRLRNKRPKAFEKIVPIRGDICEPKLGINIEDEKLLSNKVSIVFHAAATVKFDDTLEVAMNINVGGTERMLELSRNMKNIKAFIYVSTAYSNTNRDVIEEVLYPPPASLDEVNKLLEIGICERQTKELIQDRPNTYTFTKALAEHVVTNNHGNIPSVIIRPSIVSCSKHEPLAGWVDSWLGAASIITGVSKGWNHLYLSHNKIITDVVPVDYVSNLMIVAASRIEWYTKIQNKVAIVWDTFEYFTSNSWIICASKTRNLANSLSPSDKRIFPFDPKDIDWDEYVSTYCQGIRRFLIKKKK